MYKKALLIFIIAILLWHAFSLFNEAMAQGKAKDQKQQEKGEEEGEKTIWSSVWAWMKKHTFLSSIFIVMFITIFTTVMTMLRKDNLLKELSGQLVTIELRGDQPGSDGERYRGRLRVESEGLEVVEERTNKSNEKVSYLIRKDEFGKIHTIVRYHDFLTDREKEEREREVEKVHHPSIGMRLKRKLRNVVNEMKRVASEAFKILFSKVKSQFTIESRDYGKELEQAGQEAVSYTTEATYDALIDKLIGTRVVIGVVGKDLEYVGVLKDYTSQFIELLDVQYKNSWQTTIKRDEKSKHARGLTLTKDGNDVVIQSKSPFKVRLKNIYWNGDKPDAKREKINKTIEPFGELRLTLMPPALDVVVGPFERLQLPTSYHYQDYKTIDLQFDSVRVADVVLQKSYGLVRHRTEKYEAKILDFGALADALLTSKDDELVLKGNPSATPLNLHNGYLTNLPKERMDVVAVGEQMNQRWAVGNFFQMLDKKIRPISNHYFLRFIPLIKHKKIIHLFAAISMLHSDNDRNKKALLLPLAYSSLCVANSKKRCRVFKRHVVIKNGKRLFGFIPRPARVQPAAKVEASTK